MKVLIMGLPGAGKTTLAGSLSAELGKAVWFNADSVREYYNDWDFTPEGRIRQAQRMRYLCDGAVAAGKIAVADFVAPTQAARAEFQPDFIIFMDTIVEGRYDDTNAMFEEPSRDEINYIIRDWDWDEITLFNVSRKIKERYDQQSKKKFN
jgi:adenylylsulfate kinase